ncbi:MAG: NAD(P)/FAD-dependent oxidoreductase [Deltaproteobacteria bacterium HGW-Deltaproteobacteria-21]|nr:MAG: NAD(P)/FAD-dependent oxidoreductase [Deltaproteobacteria bacterium HGW-Deltaproteobacteria-21]
MSSKNYDIVVVGAGPAGASAAQSAASLGVRVLIVERKPLVGIPVRCAEYIPAPLLGELNVGHRFVVQRVRGMKTILPDGTEKTTLTPGLMIRRDLFDQALCNAAQDAGAELLLGTAAVSLEGQKLLLRRRGGDPLEVEAKVVIGADGPHTRVGKWMESVNTHLIAAVQAVVPLVRPLEHTEVYFDKDFCGGYGWLFPKGGEANVGLGIRKDLCNPNILRTAIDGFLERLTREGKIVNAPVSRTAGWVPSEPPRTVVKGRLLLAGDAAGQTHPITGAGVFQAVMGGKMAGKWAATAVREDNLSLLAGYEEEWKDLFEETHQRAFQRRLLLDKEWEKLDQVIKKCWVAFREYYEDH